MDWKARLPLLSAALWWGSLTATGFLAVPLLGVIPESKAILKASNVGTPVVLDEPSAASRAYEDAVSRLTGTQVEMRIQGERRPGLFQRLFKRAS